MHNIEEKQGYKFTEEFGYIPEDWGVCYIKDVSTIFGRIGFRGYTIEDIVKENEGAISLSPSNIIDGNISYKNCTYISLFKYEESPEIKIYNNDIVLVKTGSTFGKSALIKNLYEKATLNPQLIVFKNLKINNILFSYIMKTKYFMKQIYGTIVGGAIPTLSQEQVYKFNILVPTKLEQEKIAEVLSDIDELIASTQKLIDKKKDLKTATMQKILTPKENWKQKTLEEIFFILDNLRIPLNESQRRSGEYPYCGANGIVDYIDNWCIDDDIILIAEDGGYFDEYATRKIAYKINGKCWVNNHAHILKAKQEYSQELLYQMLVHKNITNYITGGTRAKLNKEVLLKIEFVVPTSYTEQQKIAQTLFDMDAEIEALEKELNKYKDLKTGMMQELLTGKKRLLNSPNKVELFNAKKMSTPANKKVANDEFKDAIIISMLAYKFGSNQYPLGAFRRQKLSYLFKRHNNLPIDEYLKKAMGPYNPQMKYSGGEGIAIRNKYVKEVKQRGLIASSEIAKAKTYFDKYYSEDSLLWLEQNFRYKSNNELEVLATIDYTILDLKAQNKEITLVNIKEYINNNAEWKPKLEKPFFTDSAIIKAIQESKNLLNSH